MSRLRNPFHKREVPPIRSPRFTDQNESQTFRRSRTLTGSTASHVRTVSEERAQLKSPRLKEHELRTHRRRLGAYLFGVTLAIGALGMLLSQFIGIVQIALVAKSPLTTQPDTTVYLKMVDEYFTTHPFERFQFALNHEQFLNFIDTKAPELANVTFDNTGIATADASLSFREPLVAWQLAGQRYYVDSTGHSYTQNYFAEPSITVKDESGIDPSAGAIVSDRFLRFMGRVIAVTNESGLRVTGVTIPPNTTREIDITVEGRGYPLKTLLDRDPASQAADIINAVKYIDEKGIKPQYVDVRVGGKAVYR